MVGRTNGTRHSTARPGGNEPRGDTLGTLAEGRNEVAGVPLFADGEVLGGLPTEFAVWPGALQLWLPWPAA